MISFASLSLISLSILSFPPLLLCVLHRGAADCSQAIPLNIDCQLTLLLVRGGNKLGAEAQMRRQRLFFLSFF